MDAEVRVKLIRRASIISILGNLVLAVAKIIVGFFAGSLSVIADGIDSGTDVIVSLVALLATRIMAKPSDAEHPFGHGRAETIATSILAFVIFFAGAQLGLNTISHLLSAEARELPQPYALWVIAGSIVGKILLAFNQFRTGKKTSSALLIANGKNMRNDILISIAVLIGLLFTFGLGLPIVDTIVALVLSAWILRTAISIFIEVNSELMDGNEDKTLYLAMFEAVRTVPQASNPHRARIRRIANLYDIELDIEVEGSLTVTESHEIVRKVEEAIKQRLETVYDVMIHVEPKGYHEEEQFGLNERSVEESKSS